MRRLFLAALALLWAAAAAHAQTTFPTPQPGVNAPGFVAMCPSVDGKYVPCNGPGSKPLRVDPSGTTTQPVNLNLAGAAVSVSNPLPVNASVTATVSGFAPGSVYGTPLSVSTVSSTATLPSGTTVVAYNVGGVGAYCKLGTAGVTATVSDDYIPQNGAASYTVGSNTLLACLTASSTTTINTSGGSGLFTGTAGFNVGGSNSAASATGSAVPAIAGYTGLNLSGNLVGWTAVNPSGSIEAGQVDLASVGGITLLRGAGATGTGSARVTAAQDTTTIAGSAPGTAGSASANVLTVQGVASMTPVGVSAASAALAAGAGADGWDVTEGTKADTAYTSGSGSVVSVLKGIYGNTAAAIPAGTNAIGSVTSVGSQYPTGATPETASATGTTAATTATLGAASSVTTYICGFSIRANATAAATGNATVTGTITGTLNFTQWTAPLASGLGVTEEIFTPCVPASAVDSAIAVVSAAPGAGGTVSVSAWGYTK